MRKATLSRIIITTHCHATEDVEKVKQALLNVFPPNLRDSINIEQETLYGYHGNPIIRFKIVLEGDEAVEMLKYLLKMLKETDRNLIINTIDVRYNKKSNEFFMRLSKQEAYMGNIAVYDGDDAIRVSISFSVEKSLEAARNLLENLIKDGVYRSV
ncbi:MAG: RNA-binding domain-containing protein [Ignisphaera sp.]